jgi:hypothetical protein
LVFTNQNGGLVNRHAVAKAVTRAALRAGLDPSGLGTHAGRRRTVTVLYAEAGLELSDIARYAGHAGEATTLGYVRHLGQRPKTMAAGILDCAIEDAPTVVIDRCSRTPQATTSAINALTFGESGPGLSGCRSS